jgi:hypothetical protein
VPDPKVGEEICVYLQLREGVNITEQDIIDYCKDKVGVHMRLIAYIHCIYIIVF